MAGIQDCYSKSKGQTRTRGNFLKATYDALSLTYPYLSPDFWGQCNLDGHPFVEFSNVFMKSENFEDQRKGRRGGGRRY